MLQIKETTENSIQCNFCDSKKSIIILYNDGKQNNNIHLCKKCFEHLHNVLSEYDKISLLEKIIALKELGCSRNTMNDIILGKDILDFLKTNVLNEDDNELL